MAKPKHPKPAIEAAIQYAEGRGWRYKPSGKSAHAWGALLCPHNDSDCRCGRFCRSSIWSTPKNPDRFANGLITVFTRIKVQTMKTYNFVLHFDLPSAKADPEDYLDALFEAGCDDALIGTGEPGVIALDFSRKAEDASSALVSAVSNVLMAIPGARLTEAGPDLLNLSEIAEWISEQVQPVTRQAIRKYAKGALAKTTVRFPAPAVSSSSPVWHLADVLVWMKANNKVDVLKAAPLLESTQVIKTFNAAVSASALDKARDARLIELAHRVAP